MKEIVLYGGEVAIIDDDDFEKVSMFKWSATKPGHRRTIYARTNIKDERLGRYRTERMHRLVLGLDYGDQNIVDHINGNGLDNRKENLRISTPSENAANVALHRGNQSGYKGVSFRKDRGTWRVEVRKDRKTVFRKSTHCIHLAAIIYNDNVVKYHKESSWLNKVKECSCDECTSYKKSKNAG